MLSAGNIGIDTVTAVNQLEVNGAVGIGTANSSYLTTAMAPAGGMIVQGNVGIGSLYPGQLLDVQGTVRVLGGGNVGIGTSATSNAALTVMNGNVGIGTWVPAGTFSVQSVITTNAGAAEGHVACWTTSGAIGYCTGITGNACTTNDCIAL